MLTVGSALYADVVIGTGNWYSWTQADLNQAGGAGFWDQKSADNIDAASRCNVGYWLVGVASAATCNNVSAGSSAGGVGPLEFYGGANKNATTRFEFDQTDNFTAVTMKVEVAGWKDINSFGYYTTGITPGTGGVLFSGLVTPATAPTVTFTVTSDFGFWLKNADGTVYTTGSTAQDNINNTFALFSERPKSPVGSTPNLIDYWIGAEDIRGGDRDFQDLLVRVSSVPEPITGLWLCGGLAGLFAIARRRKANVA